MLYLLNKSYFMQTTICVIDNDTCYQDKRRLAALVKTIKTLWGFRNVSVI